MTEDAILTTRDWLAEETRALHEALHVHPLLGRLLAPDLTRREYLAALSVFRDVLRPFEARRQEIGAFPELTLAPQVDALARDLGPASAARAPDMSWMRSGTDCLGGLYVLHGAAFGRGMIRKHVTRILPEAPSGYLDLPPGRWSRLLALLEAVKDRESTAAAARRVFSLVAEIADEARSGLLAAQQGA